jgi:hypothetical protein
LTGRQRWAAFSRLWEAGQCPGPTPRLRVVATSCIGHLRGRQPVAASSDIVFDMS